jgi:hypothetical protein
MPTQDNEEVEEIQTALEAKFMDILSQPDVVIPEEEIAEDGEFSEEQRATLQAMLKAQMPTPEAIQQQIKMTAHNAEVQKKRDERQARKRARRALTNKRRRSR